MQLNNKEISELERIKKLNLINSVSGVKPANLMGTQSSSGQTNLAIFSSVFHLGSNPPLIGFISRPTGDVPRHTIENILANGCYTINHVKKEHVEQAHYTSAKFERDVSEFESCGFTAEYIDGFDAPFVKECDIKIGVKLIDQIPISANDTILFIGEIAHLIVPDEVITAEGYIDLDKAGTAGLSGLNTYYALNYLNSFPYARVSELPKW